MRLRPVDVLLAKRDLTEIARKHADLFIKGLLYDGDRRGWAREDTEATAAIAGRMKTLGLNFNTAEALWVSDDLTKELNRRTLDVGPIRFGSESPWVSRGVVFFEHPVPSLGILTPERLDENGDGDGNLHLLPASVLTWATGQWPTKYGLRQGVMGMLWTHRSLIPPETLADMSGPSGVDIPEWIPISYSVATFDGWFTYEFDVGKGEVVFYEGDTPREAAQSAIVVVLHHLWALLREEIVVMAKERGTKKHRKALRRADIRMDWVTTVHLRRVEIVGLGAGIGDGAGGVDWSHRWLVRGHTRRIRDRKTGEIREIWVREHIKGPEDKPVILREHVHALDR